MLCMTLLLFRQGGAGCLGDHWFMVKDYQLFRPGATGHSRQAAVSLSGMAAAVPLPGGPPAVTPSVDCHRPGAQSFMRKETVLLTGLRHFVIYEYMLR
jgi:hypothetical protein